MGPVIVSLSPVLAVERALADSMRAQAGKSLETTNLRLRHEKPNSPSGSRFMPRSSTPCEPNSVNFAERRSYPPTSTACPAR